MSAPASRKRTDRCDDVDDTFGDLFNLLTERDVQRWDGKDRSKLAALFNKMMGAIDEDQARGDDDEDGDDEEQCGQQRGPGCGPSAAAAASKDALQNRTQLWRFLERVKVDIKAAVAFDGITETLFPPPSSELFESGIPTYSVDTYLYDDNDLDDLVDDGLVHRNFCTKCGSVEHVRPTQFVSHSFSGEQLVYLCEAMLPRVLQIAPAATEAKPFSVVDVGSRLGAVVLSAAFTLRRMAKAAPLPHRVVSVEVNKEYIEVQRGLLRKQRLTDVELRHEDILGAAGLQLLAATSFVVLNNVFEWFVPLEEQLGVWRKVRGALATPGHCLVTYPSLPESLRPIFAFDMAQGKGKAPSDAAVSAAVDAFLADWVESVDLTAEVTRFVADHECDDGEASDGELEGRRELLEGMNLYRIRGPAKPKKK
jgi:hypothetical protein